MAVQLDRRGEDELEVAPSLSWACGERHCRLPPGEQNGPGRQLPGRSAETPARLARISLEPPGDDAGFHSPVSRPPSRGEKARPVRGDDGDQVAAAAAAAAAAADSRPRSDQGR